jgi:hypothetical protein
MKSKPTQTKEQKVPGSSDAAFGLEKEKLN